LPTRVGAVPVTGLGAPPPRVLPPTRGCRVGFLGFPSLSRTSLVLQNPAFFPHPVERRSPLLSTRVTGLHPFWSRFPIAWFHLLPPFFFSAQEAASAHPPAMCFFSWVPDPAFPFAGPASCPTLFRGHFVFLSRPTSVVPLFWPPHNVGFGVPAKKVASCSGLAGFRLGHSSFSSKP